MSLSLLSNPTFVASLTDVVNATSGFDFLLHPVGETVDWDDDAEFAIATNKDSDSSTPTYQWKYNIDGNKSFTAAEGTNFANTTNYVAGATTSKLELSLLKDDLDYVRAAYTTWIRCFVTHGGVTIRSQPARLKVGAEPDE